jgi:ArsR family transcriptional regulator
MSLNKDTLIDRHKRDLEHEKKVISVQKVMKAENIFENVSETFKTLGDPTRVKIIFALAQGELCVYCIAKILNMSDSAISHQLRILRNMKIVKHRREGQMVYYSLDDEHISYLLKDVLEHIEEE